jgi:signal transduction histidine kinase
MSDSLRGNLFRYGVAVSSVAVTTPLTLLLSPWEQAPFALFLVAVMVSSWYGGLGPGLCATALASVSLSYFFLEPVFDLRNDPPGNLRLGLFVLAAVVVGLLNGLWSRLEATLRQQNRIKQECLAELAHELGTPLSTILHAAAALRLRRSEDPAIVQTAQIIERQARTMAQLTNDILDAARLRLGKMHLCKHLIDLRDVVCQATEATRPLIENNRHRLEVKVSPEPLWLEADPLRLQQILTNLLANAAKYTPPGGEIWLNAARAEGMILVRVRDTGVGIDPKVLPHVFDLFVQAEHGSGAGLGIGLSLVRQLVEMHGGTLTASSEGLGKGSEFTISFAAPVDPSQQGVARVAT